VRNQALHWEDSLGGSASELYLRHTVTSGEERSRPTRSRVLGHLHCTAWRCNQFVPLDPNSLGRLRRPAAARPGSRVSNVVGRCFRAWHLDEYVRLLGALCGLHVSSLANSTRPRKHGPCHQANWSDGQTVSAPVTWFPRIVYATPDERFNWRLVGRGEGIHWPDLDEDISVDSLLKGLASGETQASLDRWLKSRGGTG
jgi:hypothetical protein